MNDESITNYKLRVREYYERMGTTYINLYLHDSVSNYLSLIEGKRLRDAKLLDVGCGLGIGAALISGITKLYVCLDIACSVLSYPSKLPHVDVVCADGALMPIKPKSMDYVLIVNVINAETDGEAILREAVSTGDKVLAVSPRAFDNELIHKFAGYM